MIKHEIKKITHTEYWPYWIYYAPMVPKWLWFSIKTLNPIYFTAINTQMNYGGFMDYSKFDVLEPISTEFRPKQILIKPENKANFKIPFPFPFIAKPNIGERGVHVSLINNEAELKKYLNFHSEEIILQEFVNLPLEFGIFYAKLPNQKGKILSITGKEFLVFKGDGKTSLREFIESDSRAYFNKSYLYMKFHDQQDLILKPGENLLLEEIGNHNRGTGFFDASQLISEELTDKLNQILAAIPAFEYGRLDVKTESLERLQNGDIQIIEINGANSEPTHIYDQNLSYFSGLKQVSQHLNYQFLIAKHNLKKGFKTQNPFSFLKAMIKHLAKD